MVLVHHPLQCTHYVSNEWYGTGLSSGCGDGFQSVFDDFPQAVVWGGHIHTPQNIPTSIWQGQQYSTVYKPTTELVGKTVELIKAMQKGEAMPAATEKQNNGKVEVPVYALDPVVVTKENAKEAFKDDAARLALLK